MRVYHQGGCTRTGSRLARCNSRLRCQSRSCSSRRTVSRGSRPATAQVSANNAPTEEDLAYFLCNALELELYVPLIHILDRECGGSKEIQRVRGIHLVQLRLFPELALPRDERLPFRRRSVSRTIQGRARGRGDAESNRQRKATKAEKEGGRGLTWRCWRPRITRAWSRCHSALSQPVTTTS